jgi:ureidoglycolate lyase
MAGVVEIPAGRLSAEAFAPFGQIIGEQAVPPVFAGPHIQSWRLAFEVDGATELMYSRYLHQPYEFSTLERHVNVTQSFIPLENAPSVMVVAPPTDPDDWSRVPDPKAVRAFYVSGSCGLMLWRATWHALTRFPVRPSGAAFALITGHDTQRELEAEKADGTTPRLTQVVDYEERFGSRFRVIDPEHLLVAD